MILRCAADTHLSRILLAGEAASLLLGCAIGPETQPSDVGVSCGAILAIVALDLANLHHVGVGAVTKDRIRFGGLGVVVWRQARQNSSVLVSRRYSLLSLLVFVVVAVEVVRVAEVVQKRKSKVENRI